MREGSGEMDVAQGGAQMEMEAREAAARRIQARYRGHLVRNETVLNKTVHFAVSVK